MDPVGRGFFWISPNFPSDSLVIPRHLFRKGLYRRTQSLIVGAICVSFAMNVKTTAFFFAFCSNVAWVHKKFMFVLGPIAIADWKRVHSSTIEYTTQTGRQRTVEFLHLPVSSRTRISSLSCQSPILGDGGKRLLRFCFVLCRPNIGSAGFLYLLLPLPFTALFAANSLSSGESTSENVGERDFRFVLVLSGFLLDDEC